MTRREMLMRLRSAIMDHATTVNRELNMAMASMADVKGKIAYSALDGLVDIAMDQSMYLVDQCEMFRAADPALGGKLKLADDATLRLDEEIGG